MTNKTVNRMLAAALSLSVFFMAGCGKAASKKKGSEKEDAPSIAVETATVALGSVSAAYSGTSTLEPQDDAVVVAKIGAVIKKIFVEEGRNVRAGQVLAQLEDEPFAFELAQASARLDQLSNELRRNQELFTNHLVSAEAFERVKSDHNIQKSVCEMAKLQFEYTKIKAPIDGVIVERFIKTGNMVTVNQRAFRISDFDPLWAVLHVPEKELSKMRPGLEVRLTADAVAGREFTGRILRISPVITGNSGTFKITVEVHDEARLLRPGMFVRAGIITDVHVNAVVVPKDAILTEDIESSVFLVEEKTAPVAAGPGQSGGDPPDKGKAADARPYLTAVKRKVQTGYVNTAHVEILSGVKPGDRIVTTGLSTLKDGARITILDK